jgi:hypothetical protein
MSARTLGEQREQGNQVIVVELMEQGTPSRGVCFFRYCPQALTISRGHELAEPGNTDGDHVSRTFRRRTGVVRPRPR